MKKFFQEFKAGAFGKITTSIVNDIIMPLISMITGGVDFSQWKWVLKQAVVDAEGVVTSAEVAVKFGSTIAIILDFIIIAFAVFCLVKALNSLRRKQEEPAPAPEPEPEPTPTAEDLLAEIRDLLKEQK